MIGSKLPTIERNQTTETKGNLSERRGFFWEARTRILTWYVVLMTAFVALSIPLFYRFVVHQVDERVREYLVEEVEAFENFVEQQAAIEKDRVANNTAAVFEDFLSSRIPEDDTFLLTFLDGQFYKASSPALPKLLQRDSELVKYWESLSEPAHGKRETSDQQIGSILYIVTPVTVEGQVRGLLVATHTTAGERQEATDALLIVVEVLLGVSVLALVLAWFASGKVLTPVRSLTRTARSISEADLSQRIPVQGSGEMAELASTFNDMMDRLQSAFTSQRAFINDAGHELRTPITIIRGHLELLDDDPAEQQETLELVVDELDRMSRFVEDLILLAKAERPDFLRLETVDVGALSEELFAKAKALAPRNWQLERQGQGRIVADRQRITQAIMSLAQNATQHTTEADTITLGSAVGERSAHFWVRDTGTGIAKSDQQRIFERFARTANSYRRSEGAGLGLAIVRAIAQAHGGRVQLFSKPGTGSTFSLILPLEPSQEN